MKASTRPKAIRPRRTNHRDNTQRFEKNAFDPREKKPQAPSLKIRKSLNPTAHPFSLPGIKWNWSEYVDLDTGRNIIRMKQYLDVTATWVGLKPLGAA